MARGYLDLVEAFLKTNLSNLCTLEFIDAKVEPSGGFAPATTFVCDDGSMMSLFRIDGVLQFAGQAEYGAMLDALYTAFAAQFSKGGHTLQWVWRREADPTRYLDEMFEPCRQSSAAVGLAVDRSLADMKNKLRGLCQEEYSHVALWTHPSVLTQSVLKERRQESARTRAKAGFRYHSAADPLVMIPELRHIHESSVSQMNSTFSSAGMQVRLLDVHEGVRVIRSHVEYEGTASTWRPVFPGDRLWAIDDPQAIADNDRSGLLWPSIRDQIFHRPHEKVSPEEVRVGDLYLSALTIETYQQQAKETQFDSLLRSLDRDIPVQISMHLATPSASVQNAKASIASFLVLFATNRDIKEEIKKLGELERKGDPKVGISTTIVTWHKDLSALRRNVSRISRALEGWGICDVATENASPSEAIVTAAPGVSPRSPAAMGVGPLSMVLQLLPIDRPASPWAQGTMMFRTPDYKLWPFMPGSPQQSTWIDLFLGPPGRGKSVLSNAMNLAHLLKPGYKDLPRAAIIDVQPSSKGLIERLKTMLPPDKEHLAVYYRMRLAGGPKINVFDLPLGLKRPLALHRSFIVNFLSLLTLPVERATGYANMTSLVGQVIDELYEDAADPKSAKRYQSGMSPAFDAAIKKYGIVATADTSYYELRDRFFEKGDTLWSARAQAFAVPRLGESIKKVMSSSAIRNMYGDGSDAVTEEGTKLTAAFQMQVSAAIRNYPILDGVTELTFSEARVISLDLADVSGGGSGTGGAERQTALMYLLARHVAAGDYYVHPNDSTMFDEMYVEYQSARLRKNYEIPKRIAYDEVHRVRAIGPVMAQIEIDGREGRKNNVMLGLATQSGMDVPAAIRNLANSSNVFMTAGMAKDEIDSLQKAYGLSDTECRVLRSGLHAPGPDGASVLLRYARREGNYSQILFVSRGPLEIWDNSTSSDDVSLREEMSRLVGYERALDILARAFPKGSASGTINARRRLLEAQTGREADENTVPFQLAKELCERYVDDPDQTVAVPSVV